MNLFETVLMELQKQSFVQVSAKGYTFSQIEKTRWALMEKGFRAEIVEDLKEIFIIAQVLN